MFPALNQLRKWSLSPVGRVVAKVVRGHVKDALAAEQVLLLGYGVPWLKLCNDKAIVAFPAQLGGMPAPEKADANRALICWEGQLPFADNTFDTVLLAHCLEFTSDSAGVLAECQRVLRPHGQLIAVVPNRLSLWSRREVSPLAQGRPYSKGQLTQEISDCGLTLDRLESALFCPPLTMQIIRQYALKIERFCQRYPLPGGGLWIATARKERLGGVKSTATAKNRLKLAPNLMPKPAMFDSKK